MRFIVLARAKSFFAALFVFVLFFISSHTYAADYLILPNYKGEMVEVGNGAATIRLPFVEGLSFTVAFSSGEFATIARWDKKSPTFQEKISNRGGEYVVNTVYFHIPTLCLRYGQSLPLCGYLKLPVGDEPHLYSMSLRPWSSEKDPGSPFDTFVNSLAPFEGNGVRGDLQLYENAGYSTCNPNRKIIICDFYAKLNGNYMLMIILTNHGKNKEKDKIFDVDMKESIDIIAASINKWTIN
ncbi:hypothetical protein [Ciceribacter thiooxidans]|uniref:Uncharacterized protein n=1 Tax=Ciceribacter thiooxidans TaxID=1969821 RepID=A0ABV7I1U4_9HYPH|nr:hypothetical protein [Ciceribacter thiooxidans]